MPDDKPTGHFRGPPNGGAATARNQAAATARQEAERQADDLDVIGTLAERVGALTARLQMIVDLEPGSRGAYGKFSEAQRIATDGLASDAKRKAARHG